MSDDLSISNAPSTPIRRRRVARHPRHPTDEDDMHNDVSSHDKSSTDPAVIVESVNDTFSGPYTCDVVFSFDTTGSMRSVIESVRSNLTDTVDRLFKEIKGIRIGVIAAGDYCDYPRMMWKIDLSTDIHRIKNFILGAKNTSGGDPEEMYEYVLNQACDFTWKAPVKVLVVIGDEAPHERGYEMPTMIPGFQTKLHIDWKHEVQRLKKLGITCFACHALPEGGTPPIMRFYHHISKETNGYYFPLSELQAFKDYMVAICMKAADGAETIQLLETRQKELEESIQQAKSDEEVKRIKEDLSEIVSARRDVDAGELFSSPSVRHSAMKLRSHYNRSDRTKTFATEMRTKSRSLDVSSQAFLDTLTDSPIDRPEEEQKEPEEQKEKECKEVEPKLLFDSTFMSPTKERKWYRSSIKTPKRWVPSTPKKYESEPY